MFYGMQNTIKKSISSVACLVFAAIIYNSCKNSTNTTASPDAARVTAGSSNIAGKDNTFNTFDKAYMKLVKDFGTQTLPVRNKQLDSAKVIVKGM